MQEVVANYKVEILIDTVINTGIILKYDRLVILKGKDEITLIDVGIINLDLLIQIEN